MLTFLMLLPTTGVDDVVLLKFERGNSVNYKVAFIDVCLGILP